MDSLIRLLAAFLPPDLSRSAHQHLLDPRSPLQIYKHQAQSEARSLVASLAPYFHPLVDRVVTLAINNQGWAGLCASVVVMTVVVVVMNWVRRLMMWWTRVVARAMFWAGVVLVLAWVWERGVAESFKDGVVVTSKVLGYLAVLKDFWMAEYQRYEADGNAGRPSSRGRFR